MTKGWIHTR